MIEVDLYGKATMVVQDVACPVVQVLAVLLCRRRFIIAFVAHLGNTDTTAPMELALPALRTADRARDQSLMSPKGARARRTRQRRRQDQR